MRKQAHTFINMHAHALITLLTESRSMMWSPALYCGWMRRESTSIHSSHLRDLRDARAEQSRAEQSRAEQSRAEQSRAEQSKAEQSRAHSENARKRQSGSGEEMM